MTLCWTLRVQAVLALINRGRQRGKENCKAHSDCGHAGRPSGREFCGSPGTKGRWGSSQPAPKASVSSGSHRYSPACACSFTPAARFNLVLRDLPRSIVLHASVALPKQPTSCIQRMFNDHPPSSTVKTATPVGCLLPWTLLMHLGSSGVSLLLLFSELHVLSPLIAQRFPFPLSAAGRWALGGATVAINLAPSDPYPVLREAERPRRERLPWRFQDALSVRQAGMRWRIPLVALKCFG